MDINEPKIGREDILVLDDDNFNADNVCIVSGAGTGIGRATAIAAAANGLKTVGFDIDEDEGLRTQKLAREMGGQMVFVKTDLTKDEDIERAVAEAANHGTIKYLVNIAGIQHIDALEKRQRSLAPPPRSPSRKPLGLRTCRPASRFAGPVRDR